MASLGPSSVAPAEHPPRRRARFDSTHHQLHQTTTALRPRTPAQPAAAAAAAIAAAAAAAAASTSAATAATTTENMPTEGSSLPQAPFHPPPGLPAAASRHVAAVLDMRRRPAGATAGAPLAAMRYSGDRRGPVPTAATAAHLGIAAGNIQATSSTTSTTTTTTTTSPAKQPVSHHYHHHHHLYLAHSGGGGGPRVVAVSGPVKGSSAGNRLGAAAASGAPGGHHRQQQQQQQQYQQPLSLSSSMSTTTTPPAGVVAPRARSALVAPSLTLQHAARHYGASTTTSGGGGGGNNNCGGAPGGPAAGVNPNGIIGHGRGGGDAAGRAQPLATGRQLSGLSMAATVKELSERLARCEERNAALEAALAAATRQVAERVPLARDLATARSNLDSMEAQLAAARQQVDDLRHELARKYGEARAAVAAARQRSASAAASAAATARTNDDASPAARTPAVDAKPAFTSAADGHLSSDTTSASSCTSPCSPQPIDPLARKPYDQQCGRDLDPHDKQHLTAPAIRALLRRNRQLEHQLRALRDDVPHGTRANQPLVADQATPVLTVADLDPDLRSAIEMSIPHEMLEVDDDPPFDPDEEEYIHGWKMGRGGHTNLMQDRRGVELDVHTPEAVSADAAASDIMERIADGSISELVSVSRDPWLDGDKVDGLCDGDVSWMDEIDVLIGALEQELHDERAARIQRDARIAKLMRVLDDRAEAEQVRMKSANRTREAVEARLASVEQALAAERAGRQAAEREAAALLARATRAQHAAVVNAGTLGKVVDQPLLQPQASTGRRRRRATGFFTWAANGGLDDADDLSGGASVDLTSSRS